MVSGSLITAVIVFTTEVSTSCTSEVKRDIKSPLRSPEKKPNCSPIMRWYKSRRRLRITRARTVANSRRLR